MIQPTATEIEAMLELKPPTMSKTATKVPDTPEPSATVTAAPTASPTPLECWSQGGHYETGTLRTDLLRLPLGYRVYLPPCYNDQPKRRYPVLYLIHGQSYNDDQWDRLGADEIVDKLVAAGEIPPFMIVMPYDRYGGQPTESNFGKAVVEVLIPFIDQNYRTWTNRQNRAVGGLSRGAGWAVHLGISQWEKFGALGAHSLAVFHTDAIFMRTWLDSIPPDSMPRIYLDIGERDRPAILESAVWFENLLNEKDIPHEWYLFAGFHNEEYWQEHLEQYLRWYVQAWQEQ
jgi:enterochelin esterase-like enzyme